MTTALALVLLHVLGFHAEPCSSEDAMPTVGVCYWDAATRGNGDGDSVIVFANGFTFRTVYAP